MKTTIQLNFDSRFFSYTWKGELDEKAIKRETEFIFMDIEQYIVEKWLDRKASSSKMTEDDRERLEQNDFKKFESQKHRLEVIKHK